MPVRLHRVSQCLFPRGRAGEYLQLAAAVIVEPLDAPLAGDLAIFKDFGWFGHRGLRLSAVLTSSPRFFRVGGGCGSSIPSAKSLALECLGESDRLAGGTNGQSEADLFAGMEGKLD